MRPDAATVIARVANDIDAHVEMPRHREIAECVRSMHFSHDPNPVYPSEIELHVDTGSGRFVQWTGDALAPGYARMIAEIAQGMLVAQVLDRKDGEFDPNPVPVTTIYRRDLPQVRVDDLEELKFVGWRAVPDLSTEYRVPKTDRVPEMTDVADRMLRAFGMTMSAGMEFLCEDGGIWFRHTSNGWVQTLFRDGKEPVSTKCRDFAPGAVLVDVPLDKKGPCLYSRRVPFTVDEAYGLALKAVDAEKRWVGGSLPYLRNLILMPAASYLRSEIRPYYVLLGRGGEGKTLFTSAMSVHLREHGFWGQLDLFCDSGLSAENQNLRLASHEYAFFDDASWAKGQKLFDKLKTSSAGKLPGPARVQGNNMLPDDTNRSLMVISSNNDIPAKYIDDAQRSRIMRIVLKDKSVWRKEISPMLGRYGFWPFMLASAMWWCNWQGEHAPGYPWANPATLTDEQRNIIEQVERLGHTEPGTSRPSCGWTAMGLVPANSHKKHVTEHYYRPSSKPEERSVWDALVDAYKEELRNQAEEEALYERSRPHPVEPDRLKPLGVADPLKALADAGVAGDLFPLKGDAAPEHEKEPAVRKWSGCLTDTDTINDLTGGAPMKGLCPTDDWMVLDLDVPHGMDEGKPDGLALAQELAGALFDPDGLGDPAAIVRSASGGYHLYYRVPDDLLGMLKNAAHADMDGYANGAPIDIRVGRKGFVVAPGSKCALGVWELVHLGDPDKPHTMTPRLTDLLSRFGYVRNQERPRESRPRLSDVPMPSADACMARIPQMGPNHYHDPLRGETYRLIHACADAHMSADHVFGQLRRLSDAAVGHDPADFARLVDPVLAECGYPKWA